MKNAQAIFMHPARAAQLKLIAEAQNITPAELVDRLIRDQIAAGVIPDTTPKLGILVAPDVVIPGVADMSGPVLRPVIAAALAAAFENLIDGKITGAPGAKVGGTPGSETHLFGFTRKGRGYIVAMKNLETGEDVALSLTPSLAKDYVRQLRAAAIKANNLDPAREPIELSLAS